MCKVTDHENHVRWIYLTTVLCMGEGQKYARITCEEWLGEVEARYPEGTWGTILDPILEKLQSEKENKQMTELMI